MSAEPREPLPLLAEVEVELFKAVRKFDAFNSPHEGYAVILEELEELCGSTRKRTRAHRLMRGRRRFRSLLWRSAYVLDVCDPAAGVRS